MCHRPPRNPSSADARSPLSTRWQAFEQDPPHASLRVRTSWPDPESTCSRYSHDALALPLRPALATAERLRTATRFCNTTAAKNGYGTTGKTVTATQRVTLSQPLSSRKENIKISRRRQSTTLKRLLHTKKKNAINTCNMTTGTRKEKKLCEKTWPTAIPLCCNHTLQHDSNATNTSSGRTQAKLPRAV